MNNQEIIKNDNDSKKIFTMLALIFTLMVCTTGATYAYFAISATNTTTIKGNAATASLTLTVSEEASGGTSSGATKTGVMVPQFSSSLGSAMDSSYKCIDANGNTVCKVYTISVVNGSSAAVRLNGTIQFLAPKSSSAGSNTFTNLYWSKTTDATTLGSNTQVQIKNSSGGSIASSTSAVDCSTTGNHCSQIYDISAGTACTVSTGTGCTRISLAAGGSTTFNIVVWINETENSQNATDKGEWQGIIKFEGENGKGITSTIVS